MTAYLRNPLTLVWAVLAAITVASWWISGGSSHTFQIDKAITVSVLLIAAIKSRLVIRYFMEVRFASSWLKWTCDAWLLALFLALLGFYWASL